MFRNVIRQAIRPSYAILMYDKRKVIFMISNQSQRGQMKEKSREVLSEYFQSKSIEYSEFTDSEAEDYMERWFNEFVPVEIQKECRKICFSDGEYNNYLWHIFSYEKVECLEKDDAIDRYEGIKKDRCVIFLDLEGICFEVKDIDLMDIDFINTVPDIYITDYDFRWCYIYTHESDCCGLGPYFYQKQTW